MTLPTPAPYNYGHSRHAFATRVRVLQLHPELWRQFPNGVTVTSYLRETSHRQLWREVVAFLQSAGVVSLKTSAIDINVPKLIAAVRKLDARQKVSPGVGSTP